MGGSEIGARGLQTPRIQLKVDEYDGRRIKNEVGLGSRLETFTGLRFPLSENNHLKNDLH